MPPDWFDLRTATTTVAACGLVLACIIASQAGVAHRIPGFAAWLAMAFLVPIGLALNNLQGYIPGWLAFPVGLTALNLGLWCGWVGARQSTGRDPHLWTIPVVAVISIAGAWYFSAVAPSAGGRVLLVSPIHTWSAGAAAWLLWHHQDNDLRRVLRFVSVPLAAAAIVSVARAASVIVGPPVTSGLAPTPANILVYLVASASLLGTHVGLLLCINVLTTREVRREADHDALTGLLNRHGLKRRFAAWQAAYPDGAALLVDVDHFKRVNDTLGHAEGDRLLVALAATLTRLAEPPTLACRLGGDEFTLMVATPAGATTLAAAACRYFEAHCQRSATASIGDPIPSLSIGIARVAGDLSATLTAADAALYTAKSQGRRRVVDTAALHARAVVHREA